MPKIRAVPRVYLGVAAWHGAALAMAYFHQALWNYGKLPWLVAWIVYVLAAGLSFEHLTWRAAFWVWAPVFFIIVFAFFVPALIAPAITFALVLLARFGLARFA